MIGVPDRANVRRNHASIDPTVTNPVTGPSTDFTITNVAVDWVRSNQIVMLALSRLVTAQNSDNRTKNCCTWGCCLVSSSNGSRS